MYKLKLNRHSPKNILNEFQKRELMYKNELQKLMQDKLLKEKERIKEYDEFKTIMKDRLQKFRNRLRDYEHLPSMMKQSLERSKHRLLLQTEKLEAVSPLRKLSTGYGYVQKEDGGKVSSVKDVSPGSEITTTLKDGSIKSRVESIDGGSING